MPKRITPSIVEYQVASDGGDGEGQPLPGRVDLPVAIDEEVANQLRTKHEVAAELWLVKHTSSACL